MEWPAGQVFVGGHAVEVDVRGEMLEAVQGAAGMVPGGDDDDVMSVLLAQDLNGKLRVFAGRFGVALQVNGRLWNLMLKKNRFVVETITSAGHDYSRSEVLPEELRRLFSAGRGGTTKNDNRVGLDFGREGTLSNEQGRTNKKGSHCEE